MVICNTSSKNFLLSKPILQISEWCCIVMNVVTLCSSEQVMKGVQKLMI